MVNLLLHDKGGEGGGLFHSCCLVGNEMKFVAVPRDEICGLYYNFVLGC